MCDYLNGVTSVDTRIRIKQEEEVDKYGIEFEERQHGVRGPVPVDDGEARREGFMEELCKGFRLLMDEEKGVITFESLKANSASALGLDFYKKSKGISGNGSDDDGDDVIREMLREGDMDGDGCLNQMEFCVFMFRLSPALMDASKHWIHSFF